MKFYTLGIFILFRSCKLENDQEEFNNTYLEIVCEIDPILGYCYPGTNLTSELPTFPVDTFPLNLMVIVLFTENKTAWQINDHTMFHRFKNIRELRLEGPVYFSNIYDTEPMKSTLLNQLFKLPTLTTLFLQYWKLDDSYKWKFPRNLQSIHLTKCGLTEFDLSSYPHLIQADLKLNKLKRIPQFSIPPPPLEFLILSYNPLIEFNVYDIVDFCLLSSLSINVFNAHFNMTRKYCECKRLEKYMKEFKISAFDLFRCGKLQTNCDEYSLEEVKSIRKKKCPTMEKYTLIKNANESWLLDNITLIIAWILLVIGIFIGTGIIITLLKF